MPPREAAPVVVQNLSISNPATMSIPSEPPVHIEVAVAHDGLTKTEDNHALPPSGHHHHNLQLLPTPSDDPQDPLRWPQWLKIAALISTAIANFTANFAGTGLSVAAQILTMQYRKSPNDVNALLSVGGGLFAFRRSRY